MHHYFDIRNLRREGRSLTGQVCSSERGTFRLRSHKHEYESGTVRIPVYEFRQTRVCVYLNGGRSHTYEYGLPVNFTRTSSFCAGHVLSNSAK